MDLEGRLTDREERNIPKIKITIVSEFAGMIAFLNEVQSDNGKDPYWDDESSLADFESDNLRQVGSSYCWNSVLRLALPPWQSIVLMRLVLANISYSTENTKARSWTSHARSCSSQLEQMRTMSTRTADKCETSVEEDRPRYLHSHRYPFPMSYTT